MAGRYVIKRRPKWEAKEWVRVDESEEWGVGDHPRAVAALTQYVEKDRSSMYKIVFEKDEGLWP